MSEFQGVIECGQRMTFEFVIENPRDFAGAGVGQSFEKPFALRSTYLDGQSEVTSLKIRYEDKTPLIPTLSGLPGSPTNITSFSITISGVHSYLAQVAPAGSDCTDPEGYGNVLSATEPFLVVAVTEGHHRLCVAGQDQWGRRDYASATHLDWSVDLTGPTFEVFVADGQPLITNATPIRFVLRSSEPLGSALEARHLRQSGQAGTTTWEIEPSTSAMGLAGREFLITATAIAGNGSVVPGVSAGAVADALGNLNLLFAEAASSVTYDTTAPPAPVFSSATAIPMIGRTGTPSVSLSGLEPGGVIDVFTSASCEEQDRVARRTISTASEFVALETVLVADGGTATFSFYAQQVDTAGNVSSCSSTSAAYFLDQKPPTIVSISSTSGTGPFTTSAQKISIQVEFSEDVTFSSGAARLILNSSMDGTARAVRLAGPRGSSATFEYTPSAGDFTRSLDVTGIDFSGVSVVDDAGNALSVALPSPPSTLATRNPGITVAVPRLGTVEALYNAPGNNWNSYMKLGDDGNALTISDDNSRNCTGDEGGRLGEARGCVHVGELRKFVIQNRSQCDGLSLAEERSFFNWTCVVRNGKATFVSTRLKQGLGLRDLIGSDENGPHWRTNKVTVRDKLNEADTGLVIARSDSATWWQNQVQRMPAGGSRVELGSAGTVYVIDEDRQTPTILILADRISLVALRNPDQPNFSYTLTYSDGSNSNRCNYATTDLSFLMSSTTTYPKALICASHRKFLWLEFSATGGTGSTGAQAAVVLGRTHFSRLVDGIFLNFGWDLTIRLPAVHLYRSNSNLIENLALRGLGGTGLGLEGGDSGLTRPKHNRVRSLQVSVARSKDATAEHALVHLSKSDQNILEDITLAAQMSSGPKANGLLLDSSHQNIATAVRVSNITAGVAGNLDGGNGILIRSSSKNILTAFISVANDHAGIRIIGAGSDQNTIAFGTLIANAKHGLAADAGTGSLFHSLHIANSDVGLHQGSHASNNTFSKIVFGPASVTTLHTLTSINLSGFYSVPSGQNCAVASGATGLTNDCEDGATPTLRRSLSSSDPFAGYLASTDTKNQGNNGGAVSVSSASSADWTRFDRIERFIVKKSAGTSSILDTANKGSCATLTLSDCHIMEFRLKDGADVAGKSLNGSNTNNDPGFGVISAQGPGLCSPAEALSGSQTLQIPGTLSTKFLTHALEMTGFGFSGGNGNGLCEPGEKCLYTPHIGAYQGHGGPGLLTAVCASADGDFSSSPASVTRFDSFVEP